MLTCASCRYKTRTVIIYMRSIISRHGSVVVAEMAETHVVLKGVTIDVSHLRASVALDMFQLTLNRTLKQST